MKPQEFFDKVYYDAKGIGFNHIQASICAAQSAIESGWGRSIKGNAYFGIKANRSWKGETIEFTTHEVEKGLRIKIIDKFRAYSSFKDSLKDYKRMMRRKFPDTWNALNIELAAEALNRGKYGSYATDPEYSRKVKLTAMKRSALLTSRTSMILPLYRPKQSDETTVATLSKYDHLTPISDQKQVVKVLLVRGYYLNSMGAKGKNDRAIYDDAIFVVSPEGVQSFNANSDPSAYRKRIATLKSNQAVKYKPGPHGYKRQGGPYPAFRQHEDCTVLRDGAGEETGMFHINLHRGGLNGTSSAGCLTIPPHQWDEFYGLLKGLLAKYNQSTFYVTLVDSKNVPKVSGTKTNTTKNTSNKTIGILVSVGIVVSAIMEKTFGWLSKSLESLGFLL